MTAVSASDFYTSEQIRKNTIQINAYIRAQENNNIKGIIYGFDPIVAPVAFIPESLIHTIEELSKNYCLSDSKRVVYAKVILKEPDPNSPNRDLEVKIFFDLISNLTAFINSRNSCNNCDTSNDDSVTIARACGCLNGCIGACTFPGNCTGICY